MRESLRTEGRGQIMALFALMLAILMGMAGLAIDVAHARSSAEDIQRAADAAALAGVVYLPGDTTTAQSQAASLATANGFTDDGGVTTQISYSPDTLSRKLTVHITYKVSTSFLRVLGFNSITVSRSATATYDDPIQMGAPDHVLGFAPFPTNAFKPFTGTYPQGFYLEVRGPYAGFEHGDAYSPYFVTNSSGDTLQTAAGGAAPTNLVNPCAPYGNPANGSNSTSGAPAICAAASATPRSTATLQPTATPRFSSPTATPRSTATLQPTATPQSTVTLAQNPYYNQHNGGASATVHGYNFLFTIPPSNKKVLLKIMDPLDECFFSGTLPVGTTWSNSSGASTVKGANGATESTTLIDQCGGTGSNWSASVPTTLQFTLSSPSIRFGDNTPVQPVGAGQGDLTVYTNPVVAGAEVSASGTSGTVHGAHSFQWFTLGSVQNTSSATEYVRVNVESVQNPNPATGPYAGSQYANTFGTGGNNFSLGLCSDDATDTASMGDITQSSAWAAADTTGTNVNSGCGDPNTDASYAAFTPSGGGALVNCPDSSVTCYRVNAREAYCIETLGSASAGSALNAYIPLAEIDSHYAGSEITIRLFDPGDVGLSGSDQNRLSILGPEADPSDTTNYPPDFTEAYHLDLSSASGTGYSSAGSLRPNWWAGQSVATTQCPSPSTDYNASSYQNGGATICPPLTAAGIATPLAVAQGSDHSIANGTFLQFHMVLPSTYLQGLTAGQDWWKVHYYIPCTGACSATDTTTWQVVSGSAPVHLIDQ